MADGELILELTGVRRSYCTGHNVLEVLTGVDLALRRGEWCCIYGASGSGKTTLLNLIGVLERPDAGSVVIGGVNVSGISRREAARFRALHLGFVFQSYHLFPELTVEENVALPARLAGCSAGTAREQARALIDRVGLSPRLHHRPAELSGGEQQRAAIARALINRPELLLADEPTGNLDARTGEGILDLFAELLAEDPSRTILMITHNREIASRATSVLELQNGILQSMEMKR